MLGDYLRRHIDQLGITDGDFADRAGIAASVLSQIINDPTKGLHLSTAVKLASALGIALADVARMGGLDVPDHEPSASEWDRIFEARPRLRAILEDLRDEDGEDLAVVHGWILRHLKR